MNDPLTVCKVESVSDIDTGAPFYFLGRTGEEISLVCRTEDTPCNTEAREDGWRAFRVRGQLDFSLTGILSRIAGVLAEDRIPIFAVSTYDTDYILVKAECFERAAQILTAAGYGIV